MKKPLSDSPLHTVLRNQHVQGPRHLEAYARFLAPLRGIEGLPRKAFDLGYARLAWHDRLGGWGLEGQGLEGDAVLAALDGLAENSHAVISVFHLVAYLTPDQLRDLVRVALRALAPGGLLLIESQNVQNRDAASDLPAARVVEADGLAALLSQQGFGPVTHYPLNALEVAAAPGVKGVLHGTARVDAVVAQKPGSVVATEALHVAFGQNVRPVAPVPVVAPVKSIAVARAVEVAPVTEGQTPPNIQAELDAMRGDIEAMRAEIAHLHKIKKTKLSSRSRKVRKLSDKMKARFGGKVPAPQQAGVQTSGQSVTPTGQAWQIEGPFDSSYSLALVNRALARGLARAGQEVTLVSAEGPGPFAPDADFMRANPDLAAMVKQAGRGGAPRLVTRNMFPPRVDDLPKGETLGGLHCWAWEETGLPPQFVADFNAHLDFMTVTSPHVQRVLIDNGVTVPAYVVGNGVDHIDARGADLTHLPDLPEHVTQAARVFVHVSSCFPRKGADVLLQAWAQAFAGRDDVALVIKTFDNPHNDINEQIAQRADLAQVHVISDDISPQAMAALLARADVAVLPSRAEGFGLPVAEALMAGCRVLTTGWSGQKIFEGCPLLTFTDYQLARAGSHLTDGDSLWAEPDVFDLAYMMKKAAADPAPSVSEKQAAQDWLLTRFSWDGVARRNIAAAADAAARAAPRAPKVGWITTFNTRCGIATYSEHLLKHMPQDIVVLAPDVDTTIVPDSSLPNVVNRCWQEGGSDLERMARQIERLGLETLVIQFNYAFFDMAEFGAFLQAQKAAGRSIVMMLHGTNDARAPADRQLSSITPALRLCDRLFVHALADVSRLKMMGVSENVTLMSHGVLPPAKTLAPLTGPIVLGSYGFFLPGKGLIELIEATALLRKQGHDVELRMTNAEYPQPISAEEIARARAAVKTHGIEDAVQIETGFLSDDDALARLQACDLVVFPYQSSGESASGAVRYGLSAGRPVAITPLAIFSDVADICLTLPGRTPEEMAQGLAPLLADVRAGRDGGVGPQTGAVQERAQAWCDARAYPAIGARLSNVLTALHNSPPATLLEM